MTIGNVEYDVVTVLQSKLEAAAVYDQYIRDCDQAGDAECRRLLEEIKRDDEGHADRLRAQLRRLLSGG